MTNVACLGSAPVAAGAGGAGCGGGVLLDAPWITLAGQIDATGGEGGSVKLVHGGPALPTGNIAAGRIYDRVEDNDSDGDGLDELQSPTSRRVLGALESIVREGILESKAEVERVARSHESLTVRRQAYVALGQLQLSEVRGNDAAERQLLEGLIRTGDPDSARLEVRQWAAIEFVRRGVGRAQGKRARESTSIFLTRSSFAVLNFVL